MKNRQVIVISLILVAIVISFALPKPKYTSAGMLSKISIPSKIYTWYGHDVSDQLNQKDLRYNFISDIFARSYNNGFGKSFLMMVLDAGNFHNPKVCFSSSGYVATDLPDVEFKTKNKNFKARAVFFERPQDSLVIIYWICIDREITDWTGQKIKELWYTLINKKKSGLMIRFDIPAAKGDIDSAVKTAKGFVEDLSNNIPQDQAEYLFGK